MLKCLFPSIFPDSPMAQRCSLLSSQWKKKLYRSHMQHLDSLTRAIGKVCGPNMNPSQIAWRFLANLWSGLMHWKLAPCQQLDH